MSLCLAIGSFPWNCLLTTSTSKLSPQLGIGSRTAVASGSVVCGSKGDRWLDDDAHGEGSGRTPPYSPLMSVTFTVSASSAARRRSSTCCTEGIVRGAVVCR